MRSQATSVRLLASRSRILALSAAFSGCSGLLCDREDIAMMIICLKARICECREATGALGRLHDKQEGHQDEPCVRDDQKEPLAQAKDTTEPREQRDNDQNQAH